MSETIKIKASHKIWFMKWDFFHSMDFKNCEILTKFWRNFDEILATGEWPRDERSKLSTLTIRSKTKTILGINCKLKTFKAQIFKSI
jgi:hypothetical protein